MYFRRADVVSADRQWVAAAIVQGALAVHLKIYPIIYLPSIFLFMANEGRNIWFGFYDIVNFCWTCIYNLKGFVFAMASLLFFLNCVAIGYMLYEQKFLDEFLLYHVTRSDVRHNFSPYFYPLYLAVGDVQMTKVISLGAFIPQMTMIVIFAVRYHDDLPFCWFLTTYSFVSLNKVSTSQYFSWYLCFMPLIYCRIKMCSTKAVKLMVLWFFGQAQWLLPAYLLEFQGFNTFIWLWLASLAFMSINFYIIGSVISHYESHRTQPVQHAKKTQ